MTNAAMAQSINRLSQADDPKKALIDNIKQIHIDSYRLFEDDVLIGTYIRPEKTKGGIFLTDNAKQEDRFQGKVGLLLKAGPMAFKFDKSGQFHLEGDKPAVGDWVIYRPSDAWEISLNGVSCRIIRSCLIRGAVNDPASIW